jgi:hypothetical protein
MEGRDMNQRDLEGISALVTGASSGIGRAAAQLDHLVDQAGTVEVLVNAIAAGPGLTPGAAPERIEASYVTGAVIAADGGRTAI